MSLKLGSSPGEGRDYCTTTVGFQAPAANKTLCQGTFALSALGERDRVLWCYLGGHRGLWELGAVVQPCPMLCHSTWAGRFPPIAAASSISVLPGSATAAQVAHFQGWGPQPVLRDVRSFTTSPWAMRSKDLLSSDNCFFFQPPAHSSPHSLHSCLPGSEGFTHPLSSPDSKTMPFG